MWLDPCGNVTPALTFRIGRQTRVSLGGFLLLVLTAARMAVANVLMKNGIAHAGGFAPTVCRRMESLQGVAVLQLQADVNERDRQLDTVPVQGFLNRPPPSTLFDRRNTRAAESYSSLVSPAPKPL